MILDPGRAVGHGFAHLGPQDTEVMIEWDPHRGPDRERLETRSDRQGIGQRPAGLAQLRVGHGHFEDGSQHAIDR